ncbi:MAG TPA: dynamin family protein [Syntrophorhabdaceae bacterium]|nr:dynamin family protein [Syntrophorhabdaceae bacterium]
MDNISTVSDPIRNLTFPILDTIQKVSQKYRITSLARQIESCKDLLAKNPLIDVAILGQFKAGKSSFLNSIIGKQVLPVGAIPVTTVITRLSYGQNEGATVTFLDNRQSQINLDEVELFISEAKNPANEKNVEVVDIELSQLQYYEGLRLVDTPGLGSVFKYNTEISQEWLPEVGMAIVAISADRPLSENDLELISDLTEHTPKVVLLLTKVDLLSSEQQKEVVQFFKSTLKRELNKDFPVLLYSVVSETEFYKRFVDQLLLSLSRNRGSEFEGILRHKVRSLARNTLSYLDIALETSRQGDRERDILKKLILDEKVNYDLIQSELALIARENKLQTRTLIAAYLDTVHRAPLTKKLRKILSEEMPEWKGNLWRLTRRYEQWLMDTMTKEMDSLSKTEYKHFLGTLKKAHASISRSVMLFRNLLDKNIEKVLGITPSSIEWNVTVTEPTHPDIAFVHPFDFHFDLLWFLIPMCIFRKFFETHFKKLLPGIVEVHLSRLAYQWETRINKTIDEVKEQAMGYARDELATIDALLSNMEPQMEKISAEIEELKGMLEQTT